MSIRRFAFTLFALGIGHSAFAQTATTAATRSLTFPPVGLGATETAEINVVNVAANASNGTAASCTGTISFLNASGAAIGSATPFTVTAGQIFSARLAFASSGGTAPRAAIRGSVQLTLPSASPRPPCELQVSMDTFDTGTGATHAVLADLETSLGPVLGGR